jgi:hypothetical protein
METIYLTCAIVGGTLLGCQFLLGLLGFGGHHDVGGGHDFHDVGGHDVAHDAGHDTGHDAQGGDHHDQGHSAATWFVQVLTFRSVVAAVTFFGLAGMASLAGEMAPPLSLAVALAAGAAALFLVAYMMRTLYRLRSDGTARIDRAVGLNGTVYLRIPARKAGVGKVHLNLQNRTVEYQAVTSQAELATGSKIVVVAVISPDTVEVAPV